MRQAGFIELPFLGGAACCRRSVHNAGSLTTAIARESFGALRNFRFPLRRSDNCDQPTFLTGLERVSSLLTCVDVELRARQQDETDGQPAPHEALYVSALRQPDDSQGRPRWTQSSHESGAVGMRQG
jgi:hypothetical protein